MSTFSFDVASPDARVDGHWPSPRGLAVCHPEPIPIPAARTPQDWAARGPPVRAPPRLLNPLKEVLCLVHNPNQPSRETRRCGRA
jgi:hypothetical protein